MLAVLDVLVAHTGAGVASVGDFFKRRLRLVGLLEDVRH